jgi:hypothetical protein
LRLSGTSSDICFGLLSRSSTHIDDVHVPIAGEGCAYLPVETRLMSCTGHFPRLCRATGVRFKYRDSACVCGAL